MDLRGGVLGGRSAAGKSVAQSGAGAVYTFWHIVLPQASPGIIAASIFVFLESLDEFTGTFFVGAPDITTLPLLLYNASMSGNYQVSSITALILLLPSLLFMLVIHKFMRPENAGENGQIALRLPASKKRFPVGSVFTIRSSSSATLAASGSSLQP
ncbi:2-aminoethylphosphonate transport system permease PhnU [Raoultella terrigena]|uniref:2-aminoethylphosphonate transport system permease PhnU n=1 Tax=Raoultella terrigena TaxID=577 RepID=A0A485AXD9_RAOTE|nr:2-aminoethylphosphonate transport system permease PhnU [Raoultella terrigena]